MSRSRQQKQRYRCEIEVAAGLEDIAKKELTTYIRRQYLSNIQILPEAVQFTYDGDLRQLTWLKTAVAVYIIQYFDVPRPKALLGHQNFHILLDLIADIQKANTRDAFQSFYLSAAGSDSSVMSRLKDEIAAHTGLEYTEDAGDLFLRVRRENNGWLVLIRLTPRPLSVRDWRVADMEGALNAPVAQAMVQLSKPKSDDAVVNLMSGSGTLLIERVLAGECQYAIGVERDQTALNLAMSNIAAARHNHRMKLIQGDVRSLPIASNSVDVLFADLPFGQLVGSHEDNLKLYPQVMAEAARIAVADARFVLITHEVRLMEQLLANMPDWQTEQIRKVNLRGLHPRIYVLRKLQ